jgi:hypothetical protein
MEIKTEGDAHELLNFLSGFLSLSDRIRTQCRQAHKLLTKKSPEAVAVVPTPVVVTPLTTYVRVQASTVSNVVSYLSSLFAKTEVGHIVLQKNATRDYTIFYEDRGPIKSAPWKCELLAVTTFSDMQTKLRGLTGEVQLLYVSPHATGVVIRRR